MRLILSNVFVWFGQLTDLENVIELINDPFWNFLNFAALVS